MISVTVPVYNEAEALPILAERVTNVLTQLGQSWELIFINDGSQDGSEEVLDGLAEKNPSIKVVHFRRNYGQTAAMMAGFDYAQGDVIIPMDGDLQNDPSDIPKMLTKIEEGFDVCSGWRKDRQDNALQRNIPSIMANRLISFVSGVRLHDFGCSLKAYRAEVVQGLRLYGELHRFIPVLAHYRGHRVAELPVNHRPREHGRSRYGVERYVRGFLDLLTVSFIGRYRYRPLHLFGGLGLALGAIGLGILLYLTIDKLLGNAIGQRPLLILGVLMVVVGLQFFSLGLISELITSQHEERAGTRERTERDVEEVLS